MQRMHRERPRRTRSPTCREERNSSQEIERFVSIHTLLVPSVKIELRTNNGEEEGDQRLNHGKV